MDKMDAIGIDAVCGSIMDGASLTAIALGAGVSIASLLNWIEADRERSARAREARIATARLWDEKAEALLRDAPEEFGLKKAKELAHHYRWRASKIAPREYGDAVTLKGDPDAPLVTETKYAMTDEQLMRLAISGEKQNG